MSWSEFRAVVSALCLVVTTGCGFQLQTTGEYPPAMAVTYLEAADQYTVFYRKLSAALSNGGVRVTRAPGEATTVVRILHDETGQRILSVSPRNVPEEYDVFYIVRYSVSIEGKYWAQWRRFLPSTDADPPVQPSWFRTAGLPVASIP